MTAPENQPVQEAPTDHQAAAEGKAKGKSARIPYDSLTLCAVAAELRRLLVGGQIQDIRQPNQNEVLLGIRSQNRNLLLALSADAQFARVHLTTTRRPNAPVPPNFCMILRKHLEDGWIRAVRQRDFDRILEIEVGARDQEDIETPIVTLIAELMGKHSNLILISAEGKILDSARRITHRINRVRETLPGLVYQSPPAQEGRVDPFAADAAAFLAKELGSQTDIAAPELTRLLSDSYSGLSPFLAAELTARLTLPASDTSGAVPILPAHIASVWDAVFGAAAREEFAPVLVSDERGLPVGAYPFPLKQISEALQQSAESLNFALDDAFTGTVERAGMQTVTGELRGRIAGELKRAERQLQSIAHTLAESERAEEHKQAGELVLANLWRIEPGVESVIVQDYYLPEMPDRILTLNPRLSPQENADAFFARYRKARDSREKETERGGVIGGKVVRLRNALTELDRLGTKEAVASLRTQLLATGLLRVNDDAHPDDGKSGVPDFEGHKIKRFSTPEGYEIFVGETATANDFLTTRVASPNDLWLHVRAAASSHVVIRTQGKPDRVPRTVLQRAAELCAQHSAQKHSSLVSVDYTLKKYVRKPRAAAAGGADYQKESTIDVTP